MQMNVQVKHPDRQTYRHADRHADKRAYRRADRQSDRQTCRQTCRQWQLFLLSVLSLAYRPKIHQREQSQHHGYWPWQLPTDTYTHKRTQTHTDTYTYTDTHRYTAQIAAKRIPEKTESARWTLATALAVALLSQPILQDM